jgi:nicotinamidase-related amidase
MKVLVVVDMQNDFIDGALGTPEAQAIVPNVKKKIEEYIERDDLIIYTRDSHNCNYMDTREGTKLPVEHCIYGTHGWKIPLNLLPPFTYENACILNKPTFGCVELPDKIKNAFDYMSFLNSEFEIELIGLCTDICVVSNALLLKAYFYDKADISVDATCCAGVTPESHEAALKTMEMCQINVKR